MNPNRQTLPDEGHLLTPSQEGFLGGLLPPLFHSLCGCIPRNTSGDFPQLVVPVLIVWVFSFTSLEEFYKRLPGWSNVTVFPSEARSPCWMRPSFTSCLFADTGWELSCVLSISSVSHSLARNTLSVLCCVHSHLSPFVCVCVCVLVIFHFADSGVLLAALSIANF